MLKTKKPRSKKKIALLVAAAVVLLVGGAFAGWYMLKSDEPAAPPGVKLEPATKEEKSETDAHKDALVKQQQDQSANDSSSPSGKKQVSVIITNASADSVNAYISGVFEEGGTCSATFTQGGTTVTRTSVGFANVSYTQCAPITPDLPNSNGWSVVVSYTSPAAEGRSETLAF